MPAFTKGKWEITGEKKRHLGYITCNISSWVYDDESASQIEIATVDGTNNAETRANARLIAAAPELYEAVCDLLDYAYEALHWAGEENEICGKAPRILRDIQEYQELLVRIDGTEDTDDTDA